MSASCRSLALAVLLATAASAGAHPEPEPAPGQSGASSRSKASASPAKASDPGDWDVDGARGPKHRVQFDTDEVTWLSVDVSPDGRTLVIDALGDLYTLPASGGAATRITKGAAYDCQPRWSPDGRRIAFTSDRGGSDDLWTVAQDGSDARQVSHEDGVTVCCGAWDPEGRWIIGRKRLTDTSSLGTVEIWLYHEGGGKGVQLTKKDDLPDANDPVFSPDGRWIYYSARNSRYRYDRSPQDGIWQVKRHDRVTGEATTLTSASGGSCRPIPSPDGRTLAVLRRDRTKTVLVLHDLATGAERLLDDRMERDLQEGFAQGGTAPWYAWMPDGSALVSSAQGKLWRIDASTGARTAIPFTLHVDQVLTQALHPKVDLHAASFTTRVNRWPALVAGGKSFVFTALGKLWKRDVQGGAPPVEMTCAPDELVSSVTPWPDGESLAFAAWNDQAGGTLRRISVGGGNATALTVTGGQAASPVPSPDGRFVAYVRGSGATLRGEDLGDELWHELRVVSATDPANDRFVRTITSRGSARRMPRPSWSADGTRLYYQDDQPGEKGGAAKTVLRSVRLDGTDVRDHLVFPAAEEAVVSPDEHWVLVAEQHESYLVALPRHGQGTVEVALEGAAVPRFVLSNDGGEWPRFSVVGGETWLTWGTPAAFHRTKLADVLAHAEKAALPAKAGAKGGKAKGKADEKDEGPDLPPSVGVPFGLVAPAGKPHGVVAYEHGRLLTLRGEEVITDGTLLVEDDRIVAVGAAADVRVPDTALRVDLGGRTVMPGLVDVHAHLHYGELDVLPQREWRYDANLAYGVTTVYDPSASTHLVFEMAERVRAGSLVGPRIFSTGYILYGADDPNRAEVKSLADARRHVRRMQSYGATGVKSYMQPGRNQRQWIIQAAREAGLMVMPEGGGHLEMDLTFLLDGHTGIEHALPVAPLYRDVVELFARSGSGYTPTLLVAYGGLSGEHWFYQHAEVWQDEKLLTFTPRHLIDARARRRPVMNTEDDWHHQAVAASAKQVVEAGGSVQLGAHGQLQGLGAHWEMQGLAQGGMTPWQVLRAATQDGARYIGLGDEIGSLEPGKLADFIVLGKDPLADIRNTNSVEQVIVGGRRFDASTMNESWPGSAPRPRPRFMDAP